MPPQWIQQGQSPGLFESLYQGLIEPILGRTPSTALPPPGQMPGQPVPPQQGPGVADVMKLAAVPAAGMGGMVPLLMGLLGSSVMGEAGGRLGEQVGSLGGKEWGERGRQMGESLGQFAVPGEKAQLLEGLAGRYDPFRLKRPEVELPPREQLVAQIQAVMGENPSRDTVWKKRPDTEQFQASLPPLSTNFNYDTAVGSWRTGQTNKFVSLKPERLPVRTFDIPITTDPSLKWHKNDKGLNAALDTVSTIFPKTLKTLKGVHIENPAVMRGAGASYDPETGIMHIHPEVLQRGDHVSLIANIAHEL